EVRDRFDGILARIAAVPTRDGWIAVPLRPCLGGARFVFRPGTPGECEAEVAIWEESQPVLILGFARSSADGAPPLAPWQSEDALSWISLDRAVVHAVDGTAAEERGALRFIASSARFGAPGVFVAMKSVVGWSFGDALAGGWLWNGLPEEKLVAEGSVAEFYWNSFADGREEKFLEEFARSDDISDAESLALLADGCRRAPKLAAEDTPERLRLPVVLNRMKSLAGLLFQQGLHAQVARVLDEIVLRGAGDFGLLLAAVTALKDTDGPAAAIAMIEAVSGSLVDANEATDATLAEHERLLYITWLQSALAANDWNEAWHAWNKAQAKFAHDIEIYLYAVELTLARGDVDEAERLLDARWPADALVGWHPAELEGRAARLREKIAKLKVPAGSVQIRFTPGSSSIPAQALLNGRAWQDFIIDTGATVTTIPIATADQLGIRVTSTTPRRRVRTAGGEVTVPEITLDSVELGGAAVRGITALIHDLPDQPGLGLLGVNFLKNFRVELDTEAGVMNLTPLGR
ncbi:MAG: retroviral-like aspartic protease family protein, partial [Planctomycetes bacterium]|nr:retroviral-like aspartic protease family protein [Planctomycetota bacterium]